MVWITILSDFLVLDNSQYSHSLMMTVAIIANQATLNFLPPIQRMYFLYFLAFFHYPFRKSTIRINTVFVILQLIHFQVVNFLARFELCSREQGIKKRKVKKAREGKIPLQTIQF